MPGALAAATSPLGAIRAIAADVKLAHSVFALPFALLAAFMAAAPPAAGADVAIDWRRFGVQLALVAAAMFFARTFAMLANRIIDREIDARNPRTARRALPSGRVTIARALAALGASAAAFMAICALFGAALGNWWPATLGAPVLLWIGAYPLFKRFTVLCHLYLGSALALSPLAAALAVRPEAVTAQPSLWLLSAMVLAWVAGFDVLYALQDVEVDERDGLHSVPARFGVGRALVVSRLLHAAAVACLVTAAIVDPRLALLFAIGALAAIALLVYEHAVIARFGTERITLAFFTLNGLVSCVLGAAGIADVLW